MDDLDDDLWWACRGSNLEQVKNLIQKGANVNYQDDVKKSNVSYFSNFFFKKK